MTEPLRFDTTSAVAAPVPEREREARVEDLLLRGLDHYFSGQYDLAINVWTRVLFLDRGHARARAYIERARGAIAERQRHGEELVHTGAAAFQRGEAEAARRLLTAAIEHGAGTEDALALLDRLDRLTAASVLQESRAEPRQATRPGPVDHAAPGDRAWIAWVAAGAVLGMAGLALTIVLLDARGAPWLPLAGGASVTVPRASEEPLPVPSASEVWLARGRGFYTRGHLRDALAALDAIHPGDPLNPQADELRAVIQGQLLAAARGGEAARGTPVVQGVPRQ
jgi:tetratricopeptide (TPR) repeat protein